MLRLAAQILASKVADFDPKAFRDRYEQALLAHLKAKQAGTVQERKPTFPTPRRVINLMEELRRSVSDDKKQAPPRRGAAVAPARKPALTPQRAATAPVPHAMGSRSHGRTP